MPNMNIKNVNQSMDTQSCHSLSKNNAANTSQIANPYPNSLKENNSFNDPSDAFGTNNSIFCNNFMLERYHEPTNPSLYFIDETNAKTSRIELISFQKYQKYRKYHQNFNIYTSQQSRQVSRPYLGLAQFKAVMGQSMNAKNVNSNNSGTDMCKQNLSMVKSNSEPALKELLVETKKTKMPANLAKSNSICNENVFKSKQNDVKSRLAEKRSRLMYTNKSLNENHLIDPHKIPKVIQKSLIDLHKRSVWNLTHKPQANEKAKSQSKNALNFLHLRAKSKEVNSSQSNLARVITQMKSGNEIKMKINDNLL